MSSRTSSPSPPLGIRSLRRGWKGNGIEPRGNPTPDSGVGWGRVHPRGWDLEQVLRDPLEQGLGDRGSWRVGRSRLESKSPPLLPPPSTAHSQPEPGGLKIAPEAQPPAALVTFWVTQAEGGRAAGRQGAGPPGLISQGTIPGCPRGRPVPETHPQQPSSQRPCRKPGAREAGTRARGHPPVPGCPPSEPRWGPAEGQWPGRPPSCGP